MKKKKNSPIITIEMEAVRIKPGKYKLKDNWKYKIEEPGTFVLHKDKKSK